MFRTTITPDGSTNNPDNRSRIGSADPSTRIELTAIVYPLIAVTSAQRGRFFAALSDSFRSKPRRAALRPRLALAAVSEALPDPFIADSEGVSVDDDGQAPVKGQQNTEGERGNKAAGPLSDPALTHMAEVQGETVPIWHHVRLRLQ
jgi:hypothetical protein